MKKDTEHNFKEILIKQGVSKLKKFGFINVSKTNIVTDEVYSLYFSKILQELLGINLETDAAINQLIKSMNNKIYE
ncbi:MAG: hypothetical protein K8R85_03450 [Bacteroidetes bacterium]|nr:hypothetical protein [Bacteroidota bacterium]